MPERNTTLPLDGAFCGAWTGRQLVWQGEADLEVKLTAHIADDQGELQYVLACMFPDTERQVRVAEESIQIIPSGRLHFLPGKGGIQSALSQLDVLSGSLDAEVLALARRVQAALFGAHLYRWNAEFLALPAGPDSAKQFEMDATGFGLPLVLDDILGFDRTRFIRLEEQFRLIFPEIRSIKLVRESGYRAPANSAAPVPMLGRAEGKGLLFEFSRTGKSLPASQVSDGVLLVLAYLTVLHLPEPPRVILVEEPENGIHPKRLEDVLRILRELVAEQSRSQVVMTTHSPYVVDLFKPEEVSLCQENDDGSISVHRLSNSKTVREQLDVFSLGEIWTAEGEDALVRMEAPSAEEGE